MLRDALLAEFGGTAALLTIVVGSAIMGEQLAPGNTAMVLLVNSLCTGAGLFVLISVLGPVSGAHFNPLVSVVLYRRADRSATRLIGYVVAQFAGAAVGVCLAHGMFDLPVIALGIKPRHGAGQWLSEVIATAGLLVTIVLGQRANVNAMAALVGGYVAAAYWFTASTAFANPAATLARALTTTFAGIRPADVPGFVGAQFAATVLVLLVVRSLRRRATTPACPARRIFL